MCLNIYTFLGKKVFWLKSLTFSNRTKCVDILMCSPLPVHNSIIYKTFIPDTENIPSWNNEFIFQLSYSHRGCEMINDI